MKVSCSPSYLVSIMKYGVTIVLSARRSRNSIHPDRNRCAYHHVPLLLASSAVLRRYTGVLQVCRAMSDKVFFTEFRNDLNYIIVRIMFFAMFSITVESLIDRLITGGTLIIYAVINLDRRYFFI